MLDNTNYDNLPTFNHIACDESEELSDLIPDICIRIEFKTGNSKNAILFKSNDDDRIYSGYLIETLDEITLTGNWIGKFSNSSSYLITLSSELIENHKRFLRKEDGSTSLISFHDVIDKINGNNDSNYAVSNSSPSKGQNKSKLKPLPSSGWKLDISVLYDDSMFSTS